MADDDMWKFVKTLLGAGVIALAGYWLNSISSTAEKQADKIDAIIQSQSDIKSSQVATAKDVEWIKVGMSDIYTSKQADKAHAEIYRTDQDQYSKLKDLDERVKVLEHDGR